MSGCGKTTLLNLLAGLEQPTSGTVGVVDPRPALMFQDAALFPWLTVDDERRAGDELRRDWAGRSAARRADDLLGPVRLEDFARQAPHELSGGHAPARGPGPGAGPGLRLLLMDEPFGALDAITHDRLHDELERIWREVGCTVVFVTHDVGGPSASATGSCCCRAGPGTCGRAVRHRPAPTPIADTAESPPPAPTPPSTCARRSAATAPLIDLDAPELPPGVSCLRPLQVVDGPIEHRRRRRRWTTAGRRADRGAELAGLDALDTAVPPRPSTPRATWTATWPLATPPSLLIARVADRGVDGLEARLPAARTDHGRASRSCGTTSDRHPVGRRRTR